MKVIELHKNKTELIKRAVKNDREAQHVIYEVHSPKMLSVCRYYINDLQKAEEVMLNGFFKVFKNLSTFRNDGSFEGWIRRIMVREAISYLRTHRKVEFSLEEVQVYDEEFNAAPSNLGVADLQKLIDALPEGYRMVFVMYGIEGYKHHEIAEILNITEGTSKSQLFKARKMLQENIKKLNKTSYGTN
ncbi:RNA polymerase sigma-70 factor, ECF subfamily [Flavobacteriaceae bacterium MAR_2010_188]|nr:RNA polymerase sigma-70 factor, ECF subfamily [Flavobacteriaceae bacterium MAR_2010_188]